MARVYLLNIEDVNAYLERKEGRDTQTQSVEFVRTLTKQECQDIINHSRDRMSDAYSVEEFANEFNYAVENTISSEIYYIRVFED